LANIPGQPASPEGDRYWGVKVWPLDIDDYQRGNLIACAWDL
jgi:hypothetical protein